MSSTNKTVTIELSQYVGTDKPTSLSDYNGDMLKIDNAIAADRDAISTAQTKANTADGKADTNKQSIDALAAEINGDPEVPSDTGIAGDVNGLKSAVNTINSLIGNGEPTTTDKTLIGAINELAALIGDGNITAKTLAAAGTSVEFDVPTTGDNLIDFYSTDGSNYTAIDLSVAGKATLTYEASASARTVYCVIKEVTPNV